MNLKEGVQLPLGPAPVPASDQAAMDPQVAEQTLVIAVHRTSETLKFCQGPGTGCNPVMSSLSL